MSITKIYENDPIHGSGPVMDRPIEVIGVKSDVDVVHAEGTTAAGELIPAPVLTKIIGEQKLLVAEGQGLDAGEVKMVDPLNPLLSLIAKMPPMTPDNFVQVIIDPAWAQLEADGLIDETTTAALPAMESIAILAEKAELVSDNAQSWFEDRGYPEVYEPGKTRHWAIDSGTGPAMQSGQFDQMRSETKDSIQDLYNRIFVVPSKIAISLGGEVVEIDNPAKIDAHGKYFQKMTPMDSDPVDMDLAERISLQLDMFTYLETIIIVGHGSRFVVRKAARDYDDSPQTQADYDTAKATIDYVTSQFSTTDGIYDQTPAQIRAALGI